MILLFFAYVNYMKDYVYKNMFNVQKLREMIINRKNDKNIFKNIV